MRIMMMMRIIMIRPPGRRRPDRRPGPSRPRPPGGGHGPGYGVTGPARSSVRPTRCRKDGSKWSNVTASGLSESITNDSS
jgi:hypothetical protein